MEKYKKIFNDFTKPYLQNAGPEEKGDFELKYRHSYDVFENSRAICESMSFDCETAETFMVAALFHDTGRFPQYREFRTFNDSQSCNHATMGVRYILRDKLLDFMNDNQLRTVIGAIAMHNKNRLPKRIPPIIRTAAELVRDADKLDILKVLLDRMENVTDESSVALMRLEEHPDMVSEPMLISLENKTQAQYTEMKCINDFRLLILSWAYDLNFKYSRQQMIERGFLERIFDQLPKTERITTLYNPILDQLNS